MFISGLAIGLVVGYLSRYAVQKFISRNAKLKAISDKVEGATKVVEKVIGK